MTALTRLERMDEMFPELFRRMTRPSAFGDLPAAEIRLDVTERDQDYLVRAEVPGARKDDVRVQIDRNTVTVSVERKTEQERKDDKGRVLLRETSVGSALRGFTLAHDIDDKASTAKLEDGVLILTLPKRKGAGSRLLPID